MDVKVILKPTDFKNDEIRFKAFSPGGTSLYSDADFESAANAVGLVESMGLGHFTPTDLEKMLSGKIAECGILYFRKIRRRWRDPVRPKDLETAMQLILSLFYFTQKRQCSVQ